MNFLSKIKTNLRDRDRLLTSVLLISFVMVGIKKYEPGGNIDTIWYSAISRNIFQTGNFFHFYISKFYLNPIYDHMPLSYWITAKMFMLFGVSDFIARLYPILCSFVTYVFVFLIGKHLGNSSKGLSAVLGLVLCFEFTKWTGSLLHDVPLTFYCIASIYFFFLGQRAPAYLYVSSFFFALGIWTKGPIILFIPLGILIYSVVERDFHFLKNKQLVFSSLFLLFLLSILLWKPFHFEGRNYYSIFIEHKSGYFNGFHREMSGPLTYLMEFLKKAPIPLTLLFLSIIGRKKSSDEKLILYLLLSLVIPLSVASVKFPHYMLPAYPLLALASSDYLSDWINKHLDRIDYGIKRTCILFLMVMVLFPIKVTGKRSKEVLNLVNISKLDAQIKRKKTYFVGTWETDMSIFQTFKFYGNIDLIPIEKTPGQCPDLIESQLVIPMNELPLNFCEYKLGFNDCLFKNVKYCLVTDRNTTQYQLPVNEFPHELY